MEVTIDVMSTLGLTTFETFAVWAVLIIAFIGLAYAWFLRNQIMREEKGTPEMQAVWEAIRQGANAYLSRQLRTIMPFIVVLTVALFLSVYIVEPSQAAVARFSNLNDEPDSSGGGRWPGRGLCYGRNVFAARWPAGHAHGGGRQCACGRRVTDRASAKRCALVIVRARSQVC